MHNTVAKDTILSALDAAETRAEDISYGRLCDMMHRHPTTPDSKPACTGQDVAAFAAAMQTQMLSQGAPTILSQEYLRGEHGVSFSYPACGAPSAADSHGSLVLTMVNDLPFLTGGHAGSFGTAPPSACLAYKGPPESPHDAHRLNLRLGHPGRDGMKALLRSESVVGVPATTDAAMPDCEPSIMGKLRHASVSRAPASAVQPLSAFSADVFGPVDVLGVGGAKFLLGVIDHYLNYIWLAALSSKRDIITQLRLIMLQIRTICSKAGQRRCAPSIKFDSSRIPVPDTIKQALAGKYHKEWRASIVSELRSLRARNTFAYARLPGFSQQAGVDYHPTFSAVVKLSTLRTCLAVAGARGMHIHQIDIETAFLNASLKEEIYMRQPKGAEDGTDNVLRLLKSIYGLKQASWEWYELIHKTLTSLGLARSNSDTIMYSMNHPRYGIYIVLAFVDDILVVSDFVDWIRSAKSAIVSGHYKDLASASDADKAPLSREDHEKYRAILGSVNFLTMCTQPDLAFAISVLNRFQSAPQKIHLVQLKRSGDISMLNGGALGWNSKQQETTALSTTEAEYVALSRAAHNTVHFRQLLHDIHQRQ
eukprot:jgi/Tetstr1/454767/TSEL_041650.t1